MIDWNFIYIMFLKTIKDEKQAREALAHMIMVEEDML